MNSYRLIDKWSFFKKCFKALLGVPLILSCKTPKPTKSSISLGTSSTPNEKLDFFLCIRPSNMVGRAVMQTEDTLQFNRGMQIEIGRRYSKKFIKFKNN